MIKTDIKTIIYTPEQFSRLEILLVRNHIRWESPTTEKLRKTPPDLPIGVVITHNKIYLHWIHEVSDIRDFDMYSCKEVDIDFYLETKGTCTDSTILI